MKAQLFGNNKGSSTLEILLAFAILILSITAVIQIGFGNQSISIDTETNAEALLMAEEELEKARAISEKSIADFASLQTYSSTETSGSLTFNKLLSVEDISPCKKVATSSVYWDISSRPQKIDVTTFFKNVEAALALEGDCDTDIPDEWDNPTTAASVGIGGQGATDIDVKDNKIYLASNATSPAKPDIFVYDFDPVALSLSGAGVDISDGLFTLDFAGGYIFAGNEDPSGQVVVINPIPSPSISVATTLPDAPTGYVRSIYVYKDRLYVGTEYLACPPGCTPDQNNEFHIFDILWPGLSWVGRFNVNHNINDIIVRDGLAYLATSDDSGELHIYDISNPSTITLKGIFDAPGNENGTAIYLLGNKLYLGRDRTPASRKDFYILDIYDPTTPKEFGTGSAKNLGLNPGALVVGIVVRGKLAFVGVDNPVSGMRILNITDPTDIKDHVTCTTLNFSENTASIDMENNFIFTANKSNDEIRVIMDQPSTCP